MSIDEGRTPAAIKKALDPLVDWYRQHKPDIRRIVVPQDDYDRIIGTTKRTLDRNGFQVLSMGPQKCVIYKGFELVRR